MNYLSYIDIWEVWCVKQFYLCYIRQLVPVHWNWISTLLSLPHDDNNCNGGEDVISHCQNLFRNIKGCLCQIYVLCRPSAVFLFKSCSEGWSGKVAMDPPIFLLKIVSVYPDFSPPFLCHLYLPLIHKPVKPVSQFLVISCFLFCPWLSTPLFSSVSFFWHPVPTSALKMTVNPGGGHWGQHLLAGICAVWHKFTHILTYGQSVVLTM